MPRSMTSGMLTALQSSILNPAFFIQLQFIPGTVYVWSGTGSVSWNANTWTGLGSFLSLSTPEDSSVIEAKGITITLSGLDAVFLPDCLDQIQLGLPVTIYLGLYSSGSLLSDPVIAWSGRIDQPTFDVSYPEVSISINCENRLIDMNVPVDRRRTSQDQQMTYPGDLGLMFVDSCLEKNLLWGTPYSNTNI